ncbi:MAG: host attachment protein [Hyphomicrobiaceae bacterium]
MKPIKTWVLIADGARARVLENEGPGKGLKALDHLVFQGDHTATRDIVDDREGRTYNSHGPGRSAIDARTDPHRELKKTFAQHLADVMAQELDAGGYDRLVIVASPVTLGDLRKVLPAKVAAKVTGELAQDLTKTPNGDVARHLSDVLVT